MRPILSVPTILAVEETLDVLAIAPPESGEWDVYLFSEPRVFPLDGIEAIYHDSVARWQLLVPIPADIPERMYDLIVNADSVEADTACHAVKVVTEYKEDYYFVHVTDTHLPGHLYFQDEGWAGDSTEIADFRAVIEDINLIAPEFVIHTGDLINEGEFEEYADYRAFSRTKNLLMELDVPIYIVAGNHDVGGWSASPPPQGSARHNWWRFFGWHWLCPLHNPDAVDDVRTQDYYFDYGPVRYIGLEAYNNYDRSWYSVYRGDSFRNAQLYYLSDMAAATPEGSSIVFFYHMDFLEQIADPAAMGIDLSLYGHIHRDAGSLTGSPPVIATSAVCDNKRAYRMVRVRGNVLGPRETVRAGDNGENLKVRFERPNDGMYRYNRATVMNRLSQKFEFVEVDFVVPPEVDYYEVDGGDLARTFDADTALVITARLYVAANDTAYVSVFPRSDSPPPPPPVPDGFRIVCTRPNPINTSMTFDLEIPDPGGALAISLYDSAGRFLFYIFNGSIGEGEWEIPWDGMAPSGRRPASGVYFYRVKFGNATETGRIVIVK